MANTKRYVLDTNVLLTDPKAMFKFDEHDVAIPYTVLSELESKKTKHGILGYNAREAIRNIDDLQLKGKTLGKDKGCFKVYISNSEPQNDSLDLSVNDDKIINAAMCISKWEDVVLVSNDSAMRNKAFVLSDLKVEEYKNIGNKELKHLIDGQGEAFLSKDSFELLRSQGNISINTIIGNKYNENLKIHPNKCFIIKDETAPHNTLLARVTGDKLTAIRDADGEISDIIPRNAEQRFALDVLMDDSIKIVSLTGVYGSAKTFLALGAAMQLLDDRNYNQILLAKPPISINKNWETGFKPGDLIEKYMPILGSISSNLYALANGETDQTGKQLLRDRLVNKSMDVVSLEDILGSSFKDKIILLDEGQLLEKDEMEKLVSRIGENTKIIITGDLKQQASNSLIAEETGLFHLVDVFKDTDIAAHLTLNKIQRSKLAKILNEVW